MAFSHVQQAANSTAGTTTALTATGVAIGAGNFVLGIVSCGTANSTITSVTDNAGNTYKLLPQQLSGDNTLTTQGFYLFNITGAPTAITVHFTGSNAGDFATNAWDEYSSTLGAVLGPTSSATQAATNSATSGSVTIPVANSLVWGGTVNEGSATISAGASYTIRNNRTVAGGDFTATEDQLSVGIGSIAATFSGTVNDIWCTYLISVLPAFIEWGDELRGQQARRVPWRPRSQPDDLIIIPVAAVATAVAWGDIEQYIGPKRRPWRAYPQPNDIEGLPFTTGVFVEWGDELRGRQLRRIWHPPTQPDDTSGFPFTVVATLTPAAWGDVEQYIGPKRRPVNAWPHPGLTRDEFSDLIGGTPLPSPSGPPPPVPGGVNRAGTSLVGGLPQNIPVNIPTDPLQVVMAFSGLIGAINQWIGQAAPQIANPAPQVYTTTTLPSSAKPGTIVFVVDAPPGQRLRVFWGGIWNLV